MTTTFPTNQATSSALDHQRDPTRRARIALGTATTLVGLSAGFFYTFQYSVILGLAEVGDVTYVETFQAINATIRNPAFGLVFFGSIPALVLAITLNWSVTAGARRWLMTAALPLYLTVVAVTFAGNVPLNEELAEFGATEATEVAADAPGDVGSVRAGFEGDWNRLNLIRTVAAITGFACLAASMALLSGQRQPNERQRNENR